MTMTYLFRIPKPGTIPAGKVLVHNQVVLQMTPARRPGSRGFRVWLQPASELAGLYVCPCGWAPELGKHYRVRREVAAR